MNIETIVERYAEGERDFGGVDLRGAQREGIVLSGSDLREADLVARR